MNLLQKIIRWVFPRPVDIAEWALLRRHWKYMRVGPDLILTGVKSVSGRYLIVLHDDGDKKTLMILFTLISSNQGFSSFLHESSSDGLKIHEDEGHSAGQVASVCEYLLGQNYQIVLGRFERDPSDGEIRFAIALPYRDRRPSVAQVDWCIDIGVSTLDLILPNVCKLVQNGRH